MRSTQTSVTFPLSAIKPLDQLLKYRAHCVAQTREACTGPLQRREHCQADGVRIEPFGEIDGLAYARCPQDGSLWLAALPEPRRWADLLARISRHRHSSSTFHAELTQSRTDHVYAPKLEWIQDALRLQQMDRPAVLEAVTPPSPFTSLLKDSGLCSTLVTVDEMMVAHASGRREDAERVQAAVLLESLDRVDDPAALLRGVHQQLAPGGLVFVTALVSSGFDMATLGLQNRYLYPPDRTNCLSLHGLSMLITKAGFGLLEVSTPGVLDVEVVQAHLEQHPGMAVSVFERQLAEAGEETRMAFQTFLQEQGLSSFARIVGRKPA